VNAFFVWTGINLLVAISVTARLIAFASSWPRLKIPLLIAILAWTPLQLTISHGQVGLLCTLALTEALFSLDAGKPRKAGCWLALGLMKPHLIAIPLLALLIWRCWATLAAFALTALVPLTLSFIKVGFWFGNYLRFLGEFYRKGGEFSFYPGAMQNWRGLVYALLKGNGTLTAELLLAALSIGSMALLIALCVDRRDGFSWRSRAFPPSGPWKEIFSIAILLGVLTSPHLYFHDWVVALPALIVLFFSTDSFATDGYGRKRLVVFQRWLIGLSPFVCFAVEFRIWPAESRIQLLPWYMGILTITAVFIFRRSGKSELLKASRPVPAGVSESASEL
jgi:hypothetical protein